MLGAVSILIRALPIVAMSASSLSPVTDTSGLSCTPNPVTLFDFTTIPDLSLWEESSDTVRTQGMSKASFNLQKTQIFQKAIFFSLLNPLPNGACFAGFRTNLDEPLNLEGIGLEGHIEIRARAQGNADTYKLYFRHNGDLGDGSYEQHFKMDTKFRKEPELVRLPLGDFKFNYRGRYIDGHEPLNLSNITQVGIQVFGGVYEEFKQSGVSSLELEYIKAASCS